MHELGVPTGLVLPRVSICSTGVDVRHTPIEEQRMQPVLGNSNPFAQQQQRAEFGRYRAILLHYKVVATVCASEERAGWRETGTSRKTLHICRCSPAQLRQRRSIPAMNEARRYPRAQELMQGKGKRTHCRATLERSQLLLRAGAQMCHVAIVIFLQAAQQTDCQHNAPRMNQLGIAAGCGDPALSLHPTQQHSTAHEHQRCCIRDDSWSPGT